MKRASRGRWIVLAAATLVSALSPSVARADAASDAKDLFSRGRDLRAAGDCASALIAFHKAYEIYPAGLGSLRNIAECEESLGRFATARRAWTELKRALLTNKESKYEGWSDDAEKEAARLAPKVATLTVEIELQTAAGQPASSDGVETTVNGEPLAPSLVGTPLERDPGKYLVRVAGPRVAPPQEQTAELAPGDAKRVVVRAMILAEPAGVSASAPASGNDVQRTAAWVAFGVGAAGLVGAVVSGIVRQESLSDLSTNKCKDHGDTWTCPAGFAYQTDKNRGDTATTLVNVLGGVAIVSALTGGVLWVTSHSRGPGTALVLSPTGVSMVSQFGF